jgi:hypothetical protein
VYDWLGHSMLEMLETDSTVYYRPQTGVPHPNSEARRNGGVNKERRREKPFQIQFMDKPLQHIQLYFSCVKARMKIFNSFHF